MTIKYTAFRGSELGEIKKVEINRGDLQPSEVLVEILHSGVCGTDEHYKHTDMTLGHEGVGVVRAVGSEVASVGV